MRRERRGSLLAAAALVVLAAPTARASDLGDDESCSRADAHASELQDDGRAARRTTAETALVVEATRPLPRFALALPTRAARADDGTGAPLDAMRHDSTPHDTTPHDSAPHDSATGDEPAPSLGFRDRGAPREQLRDLKRLRELKLLRLFDSSELMVWLGLDRRGRPGLHFRQRDPGEEFPPAAQAAFLVEPPALRSVPATSP